MCIDQIHVSAWIDEENVKGYSQLPLMILSGYRKDESD